MELVVATNNTGKLYEIQHLLPGESLQTLQDIGFTDPIPEPYDTFEENALAKAQTIYRFCGKAVMADDSGICTEALDGAPGVFSARYAGAQATDRDNRDKLLEALRGQANRKAYYKAVICLIWEGDPYFFDGYCHGTIAESPVGEGGFGYDPLFVPEGYRETFGQLPIGVKSRLSHRGQAIRKMVAFLQDRSGTPL